MNEVELLSIRNLGTIEHMRLGTGLLLISLIGPYACSKKPEGISAERVTSDKDGKWHLDGKPWSGKHVNKFPNDKVSFEGELVEGHPHGEWTWYFESGNKKSQLNYALGLKDGNETHFYDNSNNSKMWVKTWKRSAFVESYQWQEDGTPTLPKTRYDPNVIPPAAP